MFDMTSGIIQIEIPFDMNWQQVGECESRHPVLLPNEPPCVMGEPCFCLQSADGRVGCHRGLMIGESS